APDSCALLCVLCFFFQAEDGIRDKLVTGVQTCALPISLSPINSAPAYEMGFSNDFNFGSLHFSSLVDWRKGGLGVNLTNDYFVRSEERRVGKECRYRWSPRDYQKTLNGRTTLPSNEDHH